MLGEPRDREGGDGVQRAGHLTNDDGKPEYHPSREMREAVRLSYDAWTTLFEAGIRTHGKERFIQKLASSILPLLKTRLLFAGDSIRQTRHRSQH